VEPDFMTIVGLLKDGDKCHGCGLLPGKIRRQNTAYHDDSSNWVLLCDACFEDCQAHWSDMWAEYYRGCL
jgi:hypothetical protein